MEKIIIQHSSQADWDQCITQLPHYNYYQTYAWGEHKKNQGWEVYRVHSQDQGKVVIAFQVLVKRKLKCAGILWVPGGPCGEINQFHPKLFKELAQKINLKFYVVRTSFDFEYNKMDEESLKSLGWKKPKQPLNSGESLILDLTLSLDEMEKNMSTNWRHNLKRSLKHRNAIEEWSPPAPQIIEELYIGLYDDKKVKRGFSADELQSLLMNCKKDLIIYHNCNEKNETIAYRGMGTIGKKAWDILAVTNAEGKKHYISYLLFWELIKDLKMKGIEYFDFSGADLVNNPGVYNFKKGTGAKPIKYLGEFEYANSKIIQLAFNLLLKKISN